MNNQSLKQRLLDANLGLEENDFANHYSDLYVVDKPGVFEWLTQNYHWYSHITAFISQKGSNWNGQGKKCLDIPFAHVE